MTNPHVRHGGVLRPNPESPGFLSSVHLLVIYIPYIYIYTYMYIYIGYV